MDTVRDMNIHQRINAVMRDVERLAKTGHHKYHKFAFLGHDDVTQAVRRAFVTHGIVQTVSVLDTVRANDMVGVRVSIEWVNMDEPSERVMIEAYGESGVGGKGGPNPQQVGQAVSYAVKNAQLKNFCLVGDDTPDSDLSYSDGGYVAPAEPAGPDDAPALALAVKELEVAGSPAEARKALKALTPFANKISAELNARIDELAKQKLQA